VGRALLRVPTRPRGLPACAGRERASVPERRPASGSDAQDAQRRSLGREVEVARRIVVWAGGQPLRITWGGGPNEGSLVPVFDYKGVEYSLFAIWSYGAVEIHLEYLKGKRPFDNEALTRQFLDRLRMIPDTSFRDDAISKRPSIRLSVLASAGSLDLLLRALEWAVRRIQSV
jgi:hypothetical protein